MVLPGPVYRGLLYVSLMDALSKITGLDIRFATTKDIPIFEDCLAQGACEFAYMNPSHYTISHDMKGYKAFALQTGKKCKSFVSASDQDWNNIRALSLKQKATETIRGGTAVCRSD